MLEKARCLTAWRASRWQSLTIPPARPATVCSLRPSGTGIRLTSSIPAGSIPLHRKQAKHPLSIDSADFIEDIRIQAKLAIQEADAVLFLVDAISGVTPADREVAQILRRSQKTRGTDSPGRRFFWWSTRPTATALRERIPEFYELGMGEPYPISAVHGTETGDLLDDLVANLPAEEEAEDDDSVKIAIVGKPNAGKSSLLNRLVGEERSIVSPIPGTTRDAIDTKIEI